MALILYPSLRKISLTQLLKSNNFFNHIRSFSKNSQSYARVQYRTTPFGKSKSKSFKELLLEPVTPTFPIGRGLVLGGSLIGLGGLCFYGLGLGAESGAIDRASVWPDYVRSRIATTYGYFGTGLGITAGAAVAASRSPYFINLMTRNSLLAIFATMAAIVGSGMLVRGIPYDGARSVKKMAWAAHCGIMGAVLCPMAFLGGPILIRAAWMTAGLCTGLSTIAVCAPSDKFLRMGGVLGMGLGVVFVSNLASMFFSPMTRLGAGLYSVWMYGGLVLFSLFLLYDTQKIIHHAETIPNFNNNALPSAMMYNTDIDNLYPQQMPMNQMMGRTSFDPINESMSIYLDTIHIFLRLAMMMASSNRRK